MLIPEKYIKVLEKDNNFWNNLPLGGIDDTFKLREEFRRGISWHIPSESLIDELQKYQPIISVGSGHAYTEAVAKERKIDIIATDIKPNFDNRWCRGNTFYTSVEKISARNAVLKYKDRNVFMAWPPHNTSMSLQVVKVMKKGRFLIYVGEAFGGCTGIDDFFFYLESKFKRIHTNSSIDTWSCIHDDIFIYQKK